MSESISRSSIFRSKMKNEYEQLKAHDEIKEHRLPPYRKRLGKLEKNDNKNIGIGREPGE